MYDREVSLQSWNDLGDMSDSPGATLAFSPCCWCCLLWRKERRWKEERMKVEQNKELRKKLPIAAAANFCFPPGQLWPKWMIFIKSLGFVSSVSYISPNTGRPCLNLAQQGSVALLSFWGVGVGGGWTALNRNKTIVGHRRRKVKVSDVFHDSDALIVRATEARGHLSDQLSYSTTSAHADSTALFLPRLSY